MLQKITLCCFFLFSCLSWGQIIEFKAPDYEAIGKAIQDKSSDVYYPRLLRVFKSNTTSLTPRQYEYLYYGYALQNTKDSHTRFSKEEELMAYTSKVPDMADVPQLKALLQEALDEFPFDFTYLLFLSYSYEFSGEQEKSTRLSNHVESLAKVINHSGNGLTCDTAFHVISASHASFMLDLFSIASTTQQFDGSCHFFELDAELYTIPGLYFSVNQSQQTACNNKTPQ
ncbi:DUF4919 domain-containing protein [Myroides sp. C15-4]|uniref:DUF4919 domain-containing protein n=1 Tax=Myroides sp. C15-4 TaxID=3400532 RepID=UPI003D2F7AC7